MPEPTLQTAALRYAAGDLSAAEGAAFEQLLAANQEARDALAEAVRLSAAALGQGAPKPHASTRALIRARLAWGPYRGWAWAGGGALVVAACTLVGLSLADRAEPPSAERRDVITEPHASEVAIAPPPREVDALPDPTAAQCGDPCRSVAEIWADLSTHDHVEKARDDEHRWRQRLRDLAPQHSTPTSKTDAP